MDNNKNLKVTQIKSTMSYVRNTHTLNPIKSRLNTAEGKNEEPTYAAIKTIQNETKSLPYI